MIMHERPRRGPRTDRRNRTSRSALAAGWVLVLGALPVTLSRLSGIEAATPVTQLVAFTPLVLPCALAAAVLAVLGRGRVLAVAAGLVLVLHAWWAAPLFSGPAGPAAGRDVVVAGVNAEIGGADATAVVDLVREQRVDVLVVTELTTGLRQDLTDAGLDELSPSSVVDDRPGPAGSAVFSRWDLLPTEPVPGTTLAMPQAEVVVPGSQPLLVTAVHAFPPFPGSVEDWSADLDALRGLRPVPAGARLLVGDFNATHDHVAFRRLLDGTGPGPGYRDASATTGAGFSPTWPSGSPLLTLDHVLLQEGSGYAARSVDRVAVPGTDHLALVARLATS